MFRHHGNARTFSHNIKIASLLSFVAGLVNVAGFLAVQRLTTNVTGHFAFLADEVFRLDFREALIFLFYIFSFFAGSFVSNTIVELILKNNERYVYAFPIIIETMILVAAGSARMSIINANPDVVACSLLFAMGMQNSLVTRISNSVVRTTHLTGLFTDLGIELSQLFFYRSKDQRMKLLSSVKLRLTIIGCFFLGGVVGGILYSDIQLHVLLIASFCLVTGLVYDTVKFRLIVLKRKYIKDHES
jgi:uncharacterized membrane protein YoaK (UPF0700 family)